MKLRRKLLIIPFFLLVLLIIGSPVLAQQTTPGITLTAVAGFDGYYKANQWMPVYVNAANSGAPIEGAVRVIVNPTSPTDRVVYNAPISLPTQSAKQVAIYVRVPAFASDLDVELVDENGRVLSETSTGTINQLSMDGLLYGVVTPEPGEFGFLENVDGGRSNTAVAFLGLNQLPEFPSAWNALDILVIHDSDTGQLSVAQQEALAKWVDTGGQLVVTGGANWQKTTAVMPDQLPVTITGSESIDDLPALSQRIGVPFRDAGPYVITTSSLRSGELLYHEDGLPVLARQPVGRGALYFLALDPVLAPLVDWDGSELMWAQIANLVPAVTMWGQGPQNSYSASSAISTLNAQNLPAVWQIALLMLFYIIIIGPVNYLILKRRGQTERAWLTIPVIVLLFSGIAYLVGYQLRGTDAILNQMDVAYSQIDSEYGRINSLVGLYSPNRTNYDLIFTNGALARPFDANFNNDLTGSGNIEAISYGQDVTITGIRIDVSDIATFAADNTLPAIQLSGNGSLSVNGNRIEADISIQNQSDVLLENATLLIGSEIFALGDMPPGETQTLNRVIGTGGSSYSGSPLSSNAATILGSVDYYDDPELYPRYQLLESLEGGSFNSTIPTRTRNDTALFLAWADGAQIEAITAGGNEATRSATFYVVEIPLEQNLVGGNAITIPSALLNWQELASSGLYGPTFEELYLNGGWVEFEFEPWQEFQTMEITSLAVALEPPDGNDAAPLPDVRLWDWREEIWVETAVGWGETAVSDISTYVGPGNAVRIRLEDTSLTYSKSLDAVYPVITGNLE